MATTGRTVRRKGASVVREGRVQDFYKTMRGRKDGERRGSYGKLKYRSVKVR